MLMEVWNMFSSNASAYRLLGDFLAALVSFLGCIETQNAKVTVGTLIQRRELSQMFLDTLGRAGTWLLGHVNVKVIQESLGETQKPNVFFGGHVIHWERLSLWDSETRHTPRWCQVRCRSCNLNHRCDVKETAYRRSTTGRTVRITPYVLHIIYVKLQE